MEEASSERYPFRFSRIEPVQRPAIARLQPIHIAADSKVPTITTSEKDDVFDAQRTPGVANFPDAPMSPGLLSPSLGPNWRRQHVNSFHGGNAIPKLEQWEDELEIKKPPWEGVYEMLLTCFFMTFPLIYTALGAAAAALNGRPVEGGAPGDLFTALSNNNIAKTISQAATIGVTLFPIGFGIILCKTLKTAANYKAERGTHLLTLEQLLASRSFGSALTGPLSFRRLNGTAVFLFLLWLMSPLTTQALQRFFTVRAVVGATVTQDIRYLNTATTQPYTFSRSNGNILGYVQSIANAAIILPPGSQSSPVDTYGNPKMPLLSNVESQFMQDDNGWYVVGDVSWPWNFVNAVDNTSAVIEWSSLLGLPIAGLQPNTSAFSAFNNMTARTLYWDFECSPYQNVTSEQLAQMMTNTTGAFANCNEILCPNVQSPPNSTDLDSLYVSFAMAFTLASSSSSVLFASKPGQSLTTFQATNCTMKQQLIEAEVACAGKVCAVARMRGLADDPTVLNGLQLNNSTMQTFFNDFTWDNPPVSTAGGRRSTEKLSSIFERFLVDPAQAMPMTYTALSKSVDISTVPISTLQQRFSQALNTYYQAGIAPALFVAGLPAVFSDAEIYLRVNSTANVMEVHAEYVVSWPWLMVLWLSCTVVVAVIGANAYLQAKVLGPDIMGYVSTMTHNNLYIPLPGGGALDGLERSRKLADLKVRMQDVEPYNRVGRIALASVDGKPLQAGRKYF